MRRVAFFLLLVAVPTIGLGVGWLLAARREEAAREREERGAVERAADAVVTAVGEALEDLRAREDARPYDVYNYYFAPADVLSTEEAVAVSPLAGPPDDPRIFGWFQIDPGGRVRTPSMHPEAPDAVRRHGEEVMRALQPEVLAACEGLARGSPLTLAEAQESARALRGPPLNPVQSTGEWTTELANAIREANRGSAEQRDNLARVGRARRPERMTASWEALEGVVTLTVDGKEPAPGGASEHELDLGRHTVWVRRRDVDPDVLPLSAREGAVVYTPMAYGRPGGRLALYRVVSNEGASSVQGLLLDETRIRETWLPELAERHAGAVARARFVDTDDAGECEVARALAPPLAATSLCLAPRLGGGWGGEPGGAMAWQIAALLGLCLLVVAGGVVLLRAERRAARLADMQRDFVAAVSHELRTPLTTLRMHAELLREGWVGEERRQRFYDDLVVESTRLGQLVENVLTLSRLERGRRLDPVEGDLGAAVAEAAEKRRRFVELRGFGLEVETVDVRVAFDREAVDTIVANLMDNAVKYGAGEDKVVSVSVRKTPERAILSVSDLGPGIPEGERERVFEAFYRGQGAKAPASGTGLGLSLVRRLAREQSGDAVIPQTTTGCTVEVWWPI